ncbi:CAP domain-containing protein [Streptomyces pseudovenezuelae]|nr:CAP domain-containing protein [Streptomyces pseudovenezuelae]
MGRHRRSAAGRAATSRATGVTTRDGSYASGYDPQEYSYSYEPSQSYGGGAPESFGSGPATDSEAHTRASARSAAYLFANEDDFATVFPNDGRTPVGDSGRGRSHRRRKKTVTPVKSGLLGVSAAVAIGTVAVATGSMPGLDNYKLGGGGGGDKVQAAGTPTNSATEQGGTSGSAENRDDGSSTSRDSDRAASPSTIPSTSPSTAAPSKKPTEKPVETPSEKPTTTPSEKKPAPPAKTSSPITVSAESAAEAQVLQLVNAERAKVGCSPVAANSALSELAEAFSDAMAAEGFFDHTDPSGATPWDRAAKLGIAGLGGENIARGQADAAAVMEAWMNSPGHKANILNCDFKTLGVGVHLGEGGPWWTQDFGY